jgi:hypothetical protein
MEPNDYDRTTQNESDGQIFYGHDNDDGTTDWYTKDDILDSTTNTPSDD